jgi:hypothetical protein
LGLLAGLLSGLHRSWATTGRKLPGSNLGLWRKKIIAGIGTDRHRKPCIERDANA